MNTAYNINNFSIHYTGYVVVSSRDISEIVSKLNKEWVLYLLLKQM